ncbi:MAG TPA: DUF5698 domain-containing protein [Gemmatimonadaceae bacterium]|nr:DUF5698 domain-containing protein [Gemmatimonadaceae bacterium]
MTFDPALFAGAFGALLIFMLRIVDVSCDTLRVLFAVRGKRLIAGTLGFFQAFIWIFAVGTAIRHLDSWVHILAYAAGFACGTMIGMTIEQTLAYGVAMVRIVSRYGGVEIAEAIRNRGYGVTEFAGYGREGKVEIVNCVVRRAHLDEVTEIVERWDADAFVTVEEPRILRGGSLATRSFRVASPLDRWLKSKQRV